MSSHVVKRTLGIKHYIKVYQLVESFPEEKINHDIWKVDKIMDKKIISLSINLGIIHKLDPVSVINGELFNNFVELYYSELLDFPVEWRHICKTLMKSFVMELVIIANDNGHLVHLDQAQVIKNGFAKCYFDFLRVNNLSII